MRQTGIILKNEGFALIEPENTEDGPLTPTSDTAPYEMQIKRQGDTFGNGASFDVRLVTGKFGGEQRVRRSPPGGGFMPANFSRPQRIAFREPGNTGHNQYLGQSNIMAKGYIPFRLQDPNYPSGVMTKDKGGSFFSFGGKLIFACQQYELEDNHKLGYVRVYVYNEVSRLFELAYKFDKPVDTYETGQSYQNSSPCLFEAEGELHLAYRAVDRNTSKNIVRIYKADSDLFDWSFKTSFSLRSSVVSYDSFRMRAASGAGAVMIVCYGVFKDLSGEILSDLSEAHDFDSYVSFDGAFSFKNRARSSSNIRVDASNENLESVELSMSLSKLFIPYLPPGTLTERLRDFNVKFDLFYDKVTASFVIVKCGDPPDTGVNPLRNESQVIFARTTSNSFLDWELLAKHELDVFKTLSGQSNPSSPVESSDGADRYSVKDVSVVSGEHGNVLFFVAELEDSTAGVPSVYGVGVALFDFISDDQIPPGSYRDLFAFGSKRHEDYSLVMSVCNFELNGIYSAGAQNGLLKQPDDICAVRHRNQIIYSDRVNVTDTRQIRSGLVVLGLWENLTERFGYETSLPRFFPPGEETGYIVVEGASSTVSWSESEALTEIDCGNNGDVSVVSYVGNSLYSVPDFHNRATRNFFKCRFEILVDAISGDLTVARVATTSGVNGYDLLVNINSSNEASLVLNGSGTLGAPTQIGTLTSGVNEFLFGVGEDVEGEAVAFLFHKEPDSRYWSLLVKESIAEIGNLFQVADFGHVIGATSGDLVCIGSIQLSTYGGGLSLIDGEYRYPAADRFEPFLNWVEDPTGLDMPFVCNGAPLQGNKIELFDGTLLDFYGEDSPQREDTWSSSNSFLKNSVQNVVNDLAHSFWHFSDYQSNNGDPSLVFRDDRGNKVDALSLINVFGVTSFSLTNADYDGNVFTNETSVSVTLPYVLVGATAGSGFRLMTSTSFEPGALKWWNLYLYDTDTSSYLDQYIVIDNSRNVLSLNKTVQSPASNFEFRLVPHSLSFDIGSNFAAADERFWRLDLQGPTDFSVKQLGQVILGKFFDMTPYTTSLNKSVAKDRSDYTSEFGYLYRESVDEKNLVEQAVIECRGMRRGSPDFMYLRGLVFNLQRKTRQCVFVESSDSARSSKPFFMSGGASISQSGHLASVSIPVDIQQYRPKLETNEQSRALSLSISVNRQEDFVGEVFNFAASTNATNPSYEWEFGNGTVSVLQNPTATYSDTGSYLVTCRVTDDDGQVATQRLRVSVIRSAVVSYTLSDDTPGSPVSLTTYTGTLEGFDLNAAKVTNDDVTQVLFIGDNVEFDLDQDGDFDDDVKDIVDRLEAGELSFDFRGIAPGAGSITIHDQNGNSQVFSYTFS